MPVSLSWRQPGGEPFGYRISPEVGVMNSPAGPDPMITLHGKVANVVRLPAGSVSVAVTSFWPRSKSTAGKVARPRAKAGLVYVSVVAPLVTCSTTLPVSPPNDTGWVNVAGDWWKLPQRFAGVCSVSTGGTTSIQTSTGMLAPTLTGLAASATRTRSSVGVARVPFVFSMLFCNVTPGKRATKPRPEGQLSDATAATVVTGEPTAPSVPPLRPASSVA